MTQRERLEILHARLEMYYEAERAITHSQSYSMEGLTLTRANLETVRKAIADLETQISRLERSLYGRKSRMRIIVPADGLNMHGVRRFGSG